MPGPARLLSPTRRPKLAMSALREAQDDIELFESGPGFPSGWWLIPVPLVGAAIWALLIWLAWGLFP